MKESDVLQRLAALEAEIRRLEGLLAESTPPQLGDPLELQRESVSEPVPRLWQSPFHFAKLTWD